MNVSFQISAQAAVYNERIAISLGFVTLALALAIFISCRSFVTLLMRFGLKNPTKNKAYQSFYRYHTYYWWFFGVSVVSHIMMATLHTGLPQAGDPDAGIHWIILILGLMSALSGLALFASCRAYSRLLTPAIPKLSFTGRTYKSFFSYHSYYWLVFALLVAGHFVVSYLHAGIWPGLG